jgi:hypothetical protein
MEGMVHKEGLYTNIKEVQTMRIKETFSYRIGWERRDRAMHSLHFDQAIWTMEAVSNPPSLTTISNEGWGEEEEVVKCHAISLFCPSCVDPSKVDQKKKKNLTFFPLHLSSFTPL